MKVLKTALEKVEERVLGLRRKVTEELLQERDMYKRKSGTNLRKEGGYCFRRESSRRDK